MFGVEGSDDHSCHPSSQGEWGASAAQHHQQCGLLSCYCAVCILSELFPYRPLRRVIQSVVLVIHVLQCMSHETVPQIPSHRQAHPPDRRHTLLGPKHSRLSTLTSTISQRSRRARWAKDLHSKHTLEQREDPAQPLGTWSSWACGSLWKEQCIRERTRERQLG